MKAVVNSPGYFITEAGDIFSNRKGQMRKLKPVINIKGYLYVDMYQKKKKVHRLVAEAYLPNPFNLPIINHKDNNPANNHVENLEWCDYKYNAQYAKAQGRLPANESHYNCKLSNKDVSEIKQLANSRLFFQHEIAKFYGVKQPTISEIISGKQRADA